MAKQSGIHQLKGKVGEMSYYRQAGVEPGLVRRINQGLSDRVKNGAEYANTRLNNAEFKRANVYATNLYHAITPSWRAMFRRFALAKMTTRFLEYIKAGDGTWGFRIPTTDFGTSCADVANHFAKLGEYQGEYGHITFSEGSANDPVAVADYSQPDITLTVTEDDAARMQAEGIDGIIMSTRLLLMADDGIIYSGATQQHNEDKDWTQGTWPKEYESPTEAYSQARFDIPSLFFARIWAAANAGCVRIAVLQPYRVIDGVQHILQEKCTFVAYGFKPEEQ